MPRKGVSKVLHRSPCRRRFGRPWGRRTGGTPEPPPSVRRLRRSGPDPLPAGFRTRGRL